MILEPADLRSILVARHHAGVTHRQLQVLGGLEYGYSTEEIAKRLKLSATTVRRHVCLLREKILDPLAEGLSVSHLPLWTRLHFDCCTAAIPKLVELGQLFERSVQHGPLRWDHIDLANPHRVQKKEDQDG